MKKIIVLFLLFVTAQVFADCAECCKRMHYEPEYALEDNIEMRFRTNKMFGYSPTGIDRAIFSCVCCVNYGATMYDLRREDGSVTNSLQGHIAYSNARHCCDAYYHALNREALAKKNKISNTTCSENNFKGVK